METVFLISPYSYRLARQGDGIIGDLDLVTVPIAPPRPELRGYADL